MLISALALALFPLLVACGRGESGAPAGDRPAQHGAQPGPNFDRAGIDPASPYSGRWVQDASRCGDTKSLWTIEAQRMAVAPSERFCLFEQMQSRRGAAGEVVWAVMALCLHKGVKSENALLLLLENDAERLSVKFDDTPSVDLVRCT